MRPLPRRATCLRSHFFGLSSSHFIFFGSNSHHPRIRKHQRDGMPKKTKASQPPPLDPAQKPPPPQRQRDKNGVLQGPLAQRLNSRSMARKAQGGNDYYSRLAAKRNAASLTRSQSVGGLTSPSRHEQKALPGLQAQPIVPLVDPLSRPTTVPGSPLAKPTTPSGLLTGGGSFKGSSPASQRAKTAPADEADQAA